MSRHARLLAAWVTAVLLAACGGGSEAPLPPVAPRPSPARWSRIAAASRWPEAAPAFPSRGHGSGAFVASIRVEPASLEAYRELVSGAVFADGTAVAVFHRAPDGTPGSVYAMEKAGGAWTFTASNADGMLLDGHVGLCARCHEEAPADHLFGVPRGPSE